MTECDQYLDFEDFINEKLGIHDDVLILSNFLYEILKNHDKIKFDYCQDHNIPLIIIPYWDYDNIETILQKILFEKEYT